MCDRAWIELFGVNDISVTLQHTVFYVMKSNIEYGRMGMNEDLEHVCVHTAG